jgi:hypothetical protein
LAFGHSPANNAPKDIAAIKLMVMIFTVSGFVSIAQVRSLELKLCSPSLLVLALYILISIHFPVPGPPG